MEPRNEPRAPEPSEAREFAELVRNAVVISRESEANLDAVADQQPPPGVELCAASGDETGFPAIRVHPGSMHPSHLITAALVAALAVAALSATIATVTVFRGSVWIAFAAVLGWFGFAVALHQLILLRSIALITMNERFVTITRRGLGGVQSARYERRAIVSVHAVISGLATTDEATVFDLVFQLRQLSEPSRLDAPISPPVTMRRIVLDGRDKTQLDWIAATLRQRLGVSEPLPAWPAPQGTPRWPMSVLRKMKRRRFGDT